jgi:prepilin-type processing-associated H-X9-DG protein
MAILAVLAALLVPCLQVAVGEARSLSCRSQLHQIGLAYSQYLSDSAGLWPPILTTEAPAALLDQMRIDTGLVPAPARPAANWGQPGPHWSIVLWPYVQNVDLFTCPADPKAGLRGAAVVAAGHEHDIALLDAPPESYALNVILFRTADSMRRQAGCTWGTHGDADYSGLAGYTTVSEQRRQFPVLGGRILFCCGAAGLTVGSQMNVVFRTSGLVERWEWHPLAATAAFADEPGRGSNYLFADGHAEFRDTLPDSWEWGYELTRPPAAP